MVKRKLCPPHYSDHILKLADVSSCLKGKKGNHDFASCTCGFYSYDSVEDALDHWKSVCGGFSNHVVVEIAVSGKVVVCEKGFRSTHQRITKIMFPRCWNCVNRGEKIAEHSKGYFIAGCVDCLTKVNALDSAYDFATFAELNRVEGFEPLKVGSFKDTVEDPYEFFTGMNHTVLKVSELLKKLAEEGNLVAIDEVLSMSQNLLTEAFNPTS